MQKGNNLTANGKLCSTKKLMGENIPAETKKDTFKKAY